MLIQELIVALLSTAYVHDLSPFAIKFTETTGIRWYGLSYLAGFLAAYFIILNLSKKGSIRLSTQQVSDFVFYVAVGIILGGRVGYCIFYDTSLLTRVSDSFPFWGVLEVHKGGMASHGGILGAALACILFARKEGLCKIGLFDLVALTACLGIFFGRMANFVNGELVGRICAEDYPFAVKFPQDLLSLQPDLYRQLNSVANYFGYDQRTFNQALVNLDSNFFYRLAENTITQIQKGNQELSQLTEPIIAARYPSQIYAGLLEGLLIFIVLWILHTKIKKVGLASCGFLLLYPIMRVITEQFRLPDAQLGYQALGLTRGQWISIFMFIPGVAYSLFIFKKKDT